MTRQEGGTAAALQPAYLARHLGQYPGFIHLWVSSHTDRSTGREVAILLEYPCSTSGLALGFSVALTSIGLFLNSPDALTSIGLFPQTLVRS